MLTVQFPDHEFVEFMYCPNHPLQEQIVRCGFFPTSPTGPRMAVSIRLLEFYYALFEKSGDAVMALSAALKNFYIRCGFPVVTDSVSHIFDDSISSLVAESSSGRAIL